MTSSIEYWTTPGQLEILRRLCFDFYLFNPKENKVVYTKKINGGFFNPTWELELTLEYDNQIILRRTFELGKLENMTQRWRLLISGSPDSSLILAEECWKFVEVKRY